MANKYSPQNYPNTIEDKLGIESVKLQLAKSCHSEAAQKIIAHNPFYTNVLDIEAQIALVEALISCLQTGDFFEFPDQAEWLIDCLQKTAVANQLLTEEELFVLLKALKQIQHNWQIIQNKQSEHAALHQTFGNIESASTCIQKLDQLLDAEGQLKPNASENLWQINKAIQSKEKEVRTSLIKKFEHAKKNGWAGDTEITIRNERLVIPIIAEHKKKINGYVHDDSQSGKFLYIEPIECFEGNNALKELHLDRKKEIEVILKATCAWLAPFRVLLQTHLQNSISLDALHAKAQWAIQLKCTKPKAVTAHDDTHLIDARHPLLDLQLSKDNQKIVPLQFHFKKGNSLLLISGPNAGGKSIALKTIGMLQYLYQMGLPIPVSPDSQLSVYKQIFIDIGDNQSIENHLSSYSSHLNTMQYFMQKANQDTLYLIDEIGNGTDPSIGCAIAQAILEQLIEQKAIGIVSTHYGQLKTWASQAKGAQNARMLYDVQKLQPLFILEPDKAGSSFALEVASKVGIQDHIIQRAKSINKQQKAFDLEHLITENELQKQTLKDQQERIESKEKSLEKLIQDYQALKTDLNTYKSSILKDAKTKAHHIIEEANQKIEATIKHIQETKAQKQSTNKVRKQLSQFKAHLEADIEQTPVSVLPETNFKKGMTVKHVSQTVSGEIIDLKKSKALVLFDSVKIWLPLNELQAAKPNIKHQPKTATFNVDLFNKQTQFRAEIDLRGIRGEEAMKQLDNWINDAHSLGMSSLRVVHGRGFGILRKLIIDYLTHSKLVKHYDHETEQLGGDGVTIITLY
ncbi:MAG: hypothetical protein RLZZ60_1645 [Bacteroidota bacterium]|jgi:DNA mismatch repair protein MutS2